MVGRQPDGGTDSTTNLQVQGDPTAGTPGSFPSADFLNMLQQELENVATDAGLTPDFSDHTQVRQAVAILSARNRAYPNLLINGGVEIWARGTTQGITAVQGDRFTADRFGARSDSSGGNGVCTVSKVAGGTAGEPPVGLRSTLRWSKTTAASAGAPTLFQRIEDVSLFFGRKVTVSWYQRCASNAFPVVCKLTRNFGTGGSTTAAVGSVTITTTPGDTDWNLVKDTFTVPAQDTEVVGANSFLEVAWELPSGGLFDYYFAQAQAEFGDVATPFEYLPEQLDSLLCARYFWTTYQPGDAIGTLTRIGASTALEEGFEAQDLQVRFPVPMRVIPTITWIAPDSGTLGSVLTQAGEVAILGTERTSRVTSGQPTFATSQGLGNMRAHITADAEL